MAKFIQHLFKETIIYIVNLDPKKDVLYGIDLGSRKFIVEKFPLHEFDYDYHNQNQPKFSDIFLSLRKEHFYNLSKETLPLFKEVQK